MNYMFYVLDYKIQHVLVIKMYILIFAAKRLNTFRNLYVSCNQLNDCFYMCEWCGMGAQEGETM